MKTILFLDKKERLAAILVTMLALSLTSVIQSTAKAETNDQIYLKDGSIVKGTILELTQTTCRILPWCDWRSGT